MTWLFENFGFCQMEAALRNEEECTKANNQSPQRLNQSQHQICYQRSKKIIQIPFQIFLNRNSLVRYGKSYKKCKQRNQSLILQIILHFRDNQVILKNILLCVTSGSLMQILFSQKLCVVPRSFPVIKNGSKNMNGLYIHQY